MDDFAFVVLQVYVVVGIAAVAFTGFLLMLVILRFGGNSKFGIKGRTPDFYFLLIGDVRMLKKELFNKILVSNLGWLHGCMKNTTQRFTSNHLNQKLT